MIVGLGKKLKVIRTILSNNVNDIFVCKNLQDRKDINYYTLIRLYDREIIKDVLECIYNENGKCNLPTNLFYGLFVEVNTLNILMKYQEPRKLFLYLKSYMNSDYEEHTIIKNFLYECLSLDVNYPILSLMLKKDNVNLSEDLEIFFSAFLDFSQFNKNANEDVCVKQCCRLINDILLTNEDLTKKSHVKSINLFIKKNKNQAYKKMIDLYNDFKIKERKYKSEKTDIIKIIKSKLQYIFEYKLKKVLVVIGAILIFSALIIFICNLFGLDLPFSKYKGMNVIGTVDMTKE